MELIRSAELSIRELGDADRDYQLMSKWLTDPLVLEYVIGRDDPRSLDRVRQEYSPRALPAEGVTPCLLVYRDVPIGYLQYYPVTGDLRSEYGLDAGTDLAGMYAIDQWIGEPDFWNQGLGTCAVLLLLNYLTEAKNAQTVVTDPRVDNTRAIRCYEKCGFQKIKVLPRHELHEGEYRDCWLMQKATQHKV
jgi:aminoglycoside 6'-N-acetyltransferase